VLRGHRTLHIVRKGGKIVNISPRPALHAPSPLPSANAARARSSLTVDGQRLDRHAASRIVRRIARNAGIAQTRRTPYPAARVVTAALDAGVSLRDVQAASHVDPRTTMRYDRARGSLDRHATDIVATFVALGAR
jgi:hypothetical protein